MTEPVRAITMRVLNTVWGALLLAAVLDVWIAEKNHPIHKQLNQKFYIGICVVSIFLIGTMFLIQQRSAKRLKMLSGPADPNIVRSANAVQLLLMGCSLAVVLYGLIVRFTGATLTQALPFYVVGSSLLLYFKPKEIGTDPK